MVTNGDWTTPALAILDPSGSSVVGGSATPDAASTTINGAPAYPYQLTLASAVNFAVGRWYKVTTDGVASIVRATRLDGLVLHVEPAPAITPEDGDPIVGVEVAVSIPAITPSQGQGYGYQVVLTEDDREEREDLDVLPRLFLMDFRDTDLRRLIAENYPTAILSEVELDGLIEDIRAEIRDEMISRGVYPHFFLSPSAFRRAGFAVARRLLAHRKNLYPQGRSPEEYLREVKAEESLALARIQQSWQPRDTNDDGVVDTEKFKGFIGRRRR